MKTTIKNAASHMLFVFFKCIQQKAREKEKR